MYRDTWICNNDEHVNSSIATACEICGAWPPALQTFSYELTDVFGEVSICWDVDHADRVAVLRTGARVELPSGKGTQLLKGLRNGEDITLCMANEVASCYKSIRVVLERPGIIFFKTDKEKVLKGGRFALSWSTKNATAVSITGIGPVALSGMQELDATEASYKIVAENEVGSTEFILEQELLPAPGIKVFKVRRAKLAWGEETQLVWDVAAATKVELCYGDIREAIDPAGEKNVRPSETTVYKLLVQAMDGITLLEQDLELKVYRKVEVRSFESDVKFVVESLPVKLTWDVAYADQVFIEDNFGTRTEVTHESSLEVITRKDTRYFKLIASDLLHNVLERKLEVSVKELPVPVITLPQIKLPDFDLSLGARVMEQTLFEQAFREAKKTRKPSVSFKSLVRFLYSKS